MSLQERFWSIASSVEAARRLVEAEHDQCIEGGDGDLLNPKYAYKVVDGDAFFVLIFDKEFGGQISYRLYPAPKCRQCGKWTEWYDDIWDKMPFALISPADDEDPWEVEMDAGPIQAICKDTDFPAFAPHTKLCPDCSAFRDALAEVIAEFKAEGKAPDVRLAEYLEGCLDRYEPTADPTPEAKVALS